MEKRRVCLLVDRDDFGLNIPQTDGHAYRTLKDMGGGGDQTGCGNKKAGTHIFIVLSGDHDRQDCVPQPGYALGGGHGAEGGWWRCLRGG